MSYLFFFFNPIGGSVAFSDSMAVYGFLYELFTLVVNVIILSICLHLGFKFAGSKKDFGQSFKIIAYMFTFANFFTIPFSLMISNDLSNLMRISIPLLCVLLIALWAFIVGAYGLFLTHGLSALRTLFGFIASFVVLIILAVIMIVFISLLVILQNGRR